MKKRILICLLMLFPINAHALEKEETVYSNMDYYGNVSNVSVTSHLYNKANGDIEDYSYLKDIVNINGEEKFTFNNNNLIWKALGNDIFYRGNTDKELPVKTDIKYYLNDKETKLEDMLNKSGDIRIEISFTNNMKVSGRYGDMYMPFVTVVGTYLDNNSDSVSITNGKVVNTGNKYILTGIASSGLYESTGIDKFKDFDKIVINYHTEKFKLNNIYVISKSKVFEDSDLEIFDKIDSVNTNISSLKGNMDLIVKSTKDILEGVSKLSESSNTINNNVKVILDYMYGIEDGSIKLNEGIKNSILEFNNIVSELNNGNNNDNINNLLLLMNNNDNAIKSLEYANKLLEEVYVNNNLGSVKLEDISDSSLLQVKKTYESNLSLIELLNANNLSIKTTLDNFNSINAKINNIVTMLNEKLVELNNNTSKLASGISEIRSGINELYSGTSLYSSKMDELYSGVNKLSEGTYEFSDKGINTLYNYSNTIKDYSDKIKELKEISDSYKGFSSNNCDSTLFIGVVKSSNK